jgi:hypothetical protein
MFLLVSSCIPRHIRKDLRSSHKIKSYKVYRNNNNNNNKMKSSTQVILPFLVLAGMLRDAQGQGCGRLSQQACNAALFCMWDRFNGGRCVPTFRSAQATLFDVIPSDSDAHDDYELLHKKEISFRAIDKHIDSTGHSDSGDDVSDYGYDYDYGGNDPEYDLYPYGEDIISDEYDDNLYPYGDDMDEDEDINSSSLDLDYGEPNANGDDSIIRKYLRAN